MKSFERQMILMKRTNRDMLNGPLLPNIISYTIPIILTSLLQLLFNAADLVVVGRYRGSVAVAAVGATGAITNLIVNLFIGLSVGAGVSVAHALGSREDEAVHRTVHTAIPTAIIGGLILTVIGVFFSESMLRMMGTPETVLPLATLYMQVYFGGMTFNMVYNYAASMLRAAGDTKSPLIFLTIAGFVNVGLNVIFVTAFGMNVEGVALATTISQALSAVLVVITLMRRTDACKFVPSQCKIYKPQLIKMIRIGMPAGIQGSLFSISNVTIQSSINTFGDVFMSGSAAAGNIEGFVYMAMNGFCQASVNFIGQNAGARQYDRIKKILGICMACSVGVGFAGSMLAYIFGPQLLSIYITDSQEAIQHGMVRLAYICIPYFICGLMDVTTGALRGLGASFVPMLISVLGVVGIRIGWIYTVFRIFPTPECLFLSYGISWAITGIAQYIAYRKVFTKHMEANTLPH